MAGQGEIVAGSYQWGINNYKQYQCFESGQFIQSPTFLIVSHLWHLQLYPRGQIENENIKDTICLVAQDETRKIQPSFTLTILNSDGKVLARKSRDEKISTESFWNVSNMIDMCRIKEPAILLSDSKFIILCEIRAGGSNIYNKVVAFQSKRLHQFQKFESLLNSEEFSDVKFTVGNKHIHAHKIILASGSEVFSAMFKHEMKENAENIVDIKDISYEVLHELFGFIYSGQVTKVNEIAQELLVAAEKYQVLELKSICEQQLCDNLSINNAIDYLNFSDIYGTAKLKNSSITFFVNNIDSIIDLEKFDSFMNLDAAVVKDIFQEFSFVNQSLLKSLEAYQAFEALPKLHLHGFE